MPEPQHDSGPAQAMPPPKVSGLTIQHKLMGLMVLLTAAIVGFLGVYFPSRQIDALRAGLAHKTEIYGALVAQQVRSAVAFDDVETARETFDALAQDPAVQSIVLFTERGRVLHSYGSASEAAMAAKGGVDEPKFFALSDRTLVVQPVRSLEGPRGTLSLELSTAEVARQEAEVMQTAVLVGLGALGLGLLAAWLISRSISVRLRAIADVATAVAGGDLEQPPLAYAQNDEIGVTAQAFNMMVAQLRGLFQRIHHAAQTEQARLSQMVDQRTEALNQRNADMRLVLDNVNQGLLTIDRSGVMSGERSETLASWLGPAPAPGATLWTYIANSAPELRDAFELGWDEVTAGIMPLSLTLSQMPTTFAANGRVLALSYEPIGGSDEDFERMLVVITDVTDQRERDRAQRESQEFAQVFTHVLRDRAGFLEFFSEAHDLVAALKNAKLERAELLRAVHTLKGNAGIFAMESVVEVCHELEGYMLEHLDMPRELVETLSARWEAIADKLTHLLGEDDVCRVEIGDEEYNEILRAVRSGVPRDHIEQMIEAWTLDPTSRRFDRISHQVRGLARRLGKEPLELKIEHNRVRLDPEVFGGFWSTFIHVVRNAVDHGLETAEERAAEGKHEPACVTLRSAMTRDELLIEVEDNGAGIDWDRVRDKAKSLGLGHRTQADLTEALFADGLSTKRLATEISGRGVGMAALKDACENIGGKVRVTSEHGRFTRITFAWPAAAVSKSSASPADAHEAMAITVGLETHHSLAPRPNTETKNKRTA